MYQDVTKCMFVYQDVTLGSISPYFKKGQKLISARLTKINIYILYICYRRWYSLVKRENGMIKTNGVMARRCGIIQA